MRARAAVVAIALTALGACFRNAGRTPPETTPILVTMSGELHEACALPAEGRGAPRFQYRGWALETGADRTLEHLARCLTSGPLKDATVRVTVRSNEADLAAKRAAAVKAYLVQLGVARANVLETVSTEGAGVAIERVAQ